MILRGRVALTKKVIRPIKSGKMPKVFSKNILIGLGILATFITVGITSRSVTSPNFSVIWSNVWPILAWIGGGILLIAFIWWTRPDPRKWAWKRVLITTLILILLLPALFYGTRSIYLWMTTEKSATAHSTPTSATSILLTARPEWSDWHTMPLDSKARFITEQKGLVIKFRSPSGREVVVKDDPKQKNDLSALGIMAEAVAFQVQSETGGDLTFTVHYAPKGG